VSVTKGVLSATSVGENASGEPVHRGYLLDTDGTKVLDMWHGPEGGNVGAFSYQDYAGDVTSYVVPWTLRTPIVNARLRDFRVARALIRGC
jgi:hypothetical protein